MDADRQQDGTVQSIAVLGKGGEGHRGETGKITRYHQYYLQIRQFEELRQWRGPKNIPCSKAHFSPWKTVARSMDVESLKKQGIESTRTGLKQWRVMYAGRVIADQERNS